MIRTKICGITRVEDAVAATNSGADAIGLVFYESSPRVVSLLAAAEIVAAVGPFVTTVALFVNPDPDLVRSVIDHVRPHVLQFHGDENDTFCRQFERPFLKAIRVREDTEIQAEVSRFNGACGFIFDAWSETLYGGTGKTFNWHKLVGYQGPPAILAGGLTPDNVHKAIASTKPYGVDVSGGVEQRPGVKDHEKIRHFISEVALSN